MRKIATTLIAAAALACSCGSEPSEKQADEGDERASAEQQKPSSLAEKPLVTFPENRSKRWKEMEAIAEAKKRKKAYRKKHSAQVNPTSPNPMSKKELSLDEALEGLPEKGPLEVSIETTLGVVVCELDEEKHPEGVAHFAALVRGRHPWWDGAEGTWSIEPYYRSIPIYKIEPGKAWYTGCPMGVGAAEIGYRTHVPADSIGPAREAYTLALLAAENTKNVGPQIVVTTEDNPDLGEVVSPIGSCEPGGTLTKLVNQDVTEKGYPVRDLVVERISISRGSDGS